jgi:hypothetical protein
MWRLTSRMDKLKHDLSGKLLAWSSRRSVADREHECKYHAHKLIVSIYVLKYPALTTRLTHRRTRSASLNM